MKKKQLVKKIIMGSCMLLGVALYLRANYTSAENISPPLAAKDTLSMYAKNNAPKEYNNMYNTSVLNPFFEKLATLEKSKDRKLNIVHIGDSHIQADVMPNVMRQRLQESFGNAGLGLVFPYSLVRTNGGRNVSFTSNISWEVQKNTSSPLAGITGYALSTNKKDFVIELNLKNKDYAFNTLKIITPKNQRQFELATNVGKVTAPLKPSAPKMISHKVTQGETLYAIAKKYHTTVALLQKNNHLRGSNIRIGQVLHIASTKGIAGAVPASTPATKVDMSNATILKANSLYNYYAYENLNVSDKIYLTPNTESSSYTLNGIVLENDQKGIIYHTIGVNGAHFSDYNKSELFFEQISALEPDLIVISLGTNEAYGRLAPERYDAEVMKFINTIRTQYGNCPIILTTPPPFLYKRKSTTSLCVEYADTLIDNAVKDDYSVFDLYRALGGNEAMSRFIQQNLIAGDRVHYTRDGYLEQGTLFFDAFMSNYLNYKKQSKHSFKSILN